MGPKHDILVSDQSKEKIVSWKSRLRQHSFLVNASNESFLQHVNELVYKCELEDFFVDDSEHDIKLLVYLPFKQAVLVAELFARALIVLQKHAFDENVD